MHGCHGASLYKSEDDRILENDNAKESTDDILFVNLAIYHGQTLGQPIVINYFY